MRLGRRLVPCVLSLALGVTSAWGQAKTPGVTDTEVVIGATTPLSGPAAAWGCGGVSSWA